MLSFVLKATKSLEIWKKPPRGVSNAIFYVFFIWNSYFLYLPSNKKAVNQRQRRLAL